MQTRHARLVAGFLASAALIFSGLILYDYARQQQAAADRIVALHESRPRNTAIEFLDPKYQARLSTEIVPFFEQFSGDEPRRRAALEKIAAAWQPTYAIMVLDLLVLHGELPDPGSLRELLRRKTGHDGGTDLDSWYLWIWKNVATTHPLYPEFKAFFYSIVDIRFIKYFPAGVARAIRLEEIRWGGVKQNGIVPLVAPRCSAAVDAGYLEDSNQVFGVYLDGVARAYPQRILDYHELVRDQVGSERITGVYCPLCKAMIVYSSQAGGRAFTLGTSGFLYRSNKLMFDEETNSLWSALEGRPVVGSLVGQDLQLEALPVVTTTWGEWKKRHPETTVLAFETGYQGDFDYREGGAYRNYHQEDALWYAVPHVNRVLRNKDEVLCLRDPTQPQQPVAIATAFLQKHPLHHERVGNIDVVILTDATGAARVYLRRQRHFASWDGNASAVDDRGVTWQASETALLHDDTRLPRFPAHRAFWFAWHAVYPEARLVK